MSYQSASGTWSAPTPIREINSPYLENSASISKDGKLLFFTSDRPGGYGRTDIYSAVLDKKGHWSNITNLGPEINTELDEDGVFISPSGKHLYFSSNGHAGMGDLDLYRSAYDSVNKVWGDPVNLGYPINSVENDIYIVLTSDESHALISSVRKDNIGEQDIYEVDMTRWKPVDLNQPEYINSFVEAEAKKEPVVFNTKLELLVVDDATGQQVAASADLVSEKNDTLHIASPRKGYFEVTINMKHESSDIYQLNVNAPGYVPHLSSVFFMGAQTKNLHIVDTVRLKTPVLNINLPLNIYFRYNSDAILTYDEIRNVLLIIKDTPASMEIEISGHTDDAGPAEYNLQLSQRRADAVKRYLVKAGIDDKRIKATGYGEASPIASNATPEGRRLNRRTELRVVAPKR